MYLIISNLLIFFIYIFLFVKHIFIHLYCIHFQYAYYVLCVLIIVCEKINCFHFGAYAISIRLYYYGWQSAIYNIEVRARDILCFYRWYIIIMLYYAYDIISQCYYSCYYNYYCSLLHIFFNILYIFVCKTTTKKTILI